MTTEATTSPQEPTDTLEARLRLVEDRQAIHDVIMRYCRGIDRREPELVEAAFHDDAVDNHFGVVLPFREAIGVLKAARGGSATPVPASATSSSSMHKINNVLIELDGDVARCETYVTAVVRLHFDGRTIDWTHAGRYVDRFERRKGEWRIAHRTVVYDLERFDEAVPPPPGLTQARYTEKAFKGQRGSGDFSYEVLKPRAGGPGPR